MTLEEQLLDYRQTVAAMYARVRDPQEDVAFRLERFRRERDELFCTHPQSALSDEQKATFSGIHYFPYDPSLRFELPVEPIAEPTVVETELQDDGHFRMRRFGRVNFNSGGQALSLVLYWIMGYGGGIFLPFGDLTNGHETYGGGRYLLDTIKHADLGREGSGLVIDFNYAFNPSCAYNPRWFCPLTPAENRLPIAIHAGEMNFSD